MAEARTRRRLRLELRLGLRPKAESKAETKVTEYLTKYGVTNFVRNEPSDNRLRRTLLRTGGGDNSDFKQRRSAQNHVAGRPFQRVLIVHDADVVLGLESLTSIMKQKLFIYA
ncbi:unnamed protein product [Bursaphelenchus okinawaensis]|uniref:Uncharacterized protein n=1 Tax=Bursaphelenchus okinawaensis TaxID=465554 RepID=A0A811K102_9BILA|nr:unnamed protein product [Bursaphelenchus okinawaensis]CAG9088482.1 unnamed protein product [Bursaphelenchus okinawaensis]